MRDPGKYAWAKEEGSPIRLLPRPECSCTEPHPSYYLNKGALGAESVAKEVGMMLCAAEVGCSRLHRVANR